MRASDESGFSFQRSVMHSLGVCVHGPRVTTVQMRTRCFGPELIVPPQPQRPQLRLVGVSVLSAHDSVPTHPAAGGQLQLLEEVPQLIHGDWLVGIVAAPPEAGQLGKIGWLKG